MAPQTAAKEAASVKTMLPQIEDAKNGSAETRINAMVVLIKVAAVIHPNHTENGNEINCADQNACVPSRCSFRCNCTSERFSPKRDTHTPQIDPAESAISLKQKAGVHNP